MAGASRARAGTFGRGGRRAVFLVLSGALLGHADWTPPEERHAPDLRLIPFFGEDQSSLGDIVAEEWGSNPPMVGDGGNTLTVIGGNRMFLATPDESHVTHVGPRTWRDISFRKLALLDQQLSFTVDVSKVRCRICIPKSTRPYVPMMSPLYPVGLGHSGRMRVQRSSVPGGHGGGQQLDCRLWLL